MVEHLEGPAKRGWCQLWEGEASHYWKPDLWETGAINRKFCFMLHCPLCAWDSAWQRGKARPSLAAGVGCAKPWLKARASSSMLSAQRDLFTGQCFPLYTCSDTLSLFIHPNPKFGFVINCHIGSPCRRAIAAPGGQRLFSPGCSWGPKWAELPGRAPWQWCRPLM